MPTADIHTKREAIKEFNMSLREANADDYLRVRVSEKDKDGVWRDTSGCDTVRFFKQDERSIASIDKTVFSRSLDLLSISMQIYQMMELTYISSDTKEWLRELSTKITNISNEMCRLKEQIKEEYYNDIQDTED
uniref:Uncharacterized protein n=1 Tax=Podoviridae sp. ct9A73 TaxID=2825225 RepID=A0A8S5UK24_9CAUD|nr:MAG TPA: hypothetical protein [Podoviridae sp. ct9A73]